MVTLPPRLMLLLSAVMAAAYLFSRRYDPYRPAGRLTRHLLAGFALLSLWNALPLPHLGVNPISACVAGVLGLPGVGLLATLAALP